MGEDQPRLGLLLGSERDLARGMGEAFEAAGLIVRRAGTTAEACRQASEAAYEVIVLDMDLLDTEAVPMVEGLRSSQEGAALFLLTCQEGVAPNLEPLRSLVDGVLEKPVVPSALTEALASAGRRPVRPRREERGREETALVVNSAPMEEVAARLRKVAALDTGVLLLGESGTGKELAARFLHENHPRRRSGPLVCLHCGAIPDTLLESELFGHVKGAFTGADRDRTGKFEQAHGGTLFLDEISTMKPEAQVRLLRVLQERRVTRLGASESRPVDVRVIVASNQDLRALVAEGAFRLDLYYRISAYPVRLPALRERVADLAELVEIFARRTSTRIGLATPKRFSAEAMVALRAHEWPGNVRELENVVEYASIVSDGRDTVLPQDLPEEISGLAGTPAGAQATVVVTEEGISFRTAVTNLERELILQSLRIAEGNKARAAELLDLKRTTFLEKLRRYEGEGLRPYAHPDRSSDPGSERTA